MLERCRAPEPADNPGLALGLALGALALAAPAGAGRDKVTFVADPEIASLGSWLEQLIAESTGKQGVGIVPVDLEPLGTAGGLRSGPGLRPAHPGRLGRPAAAPDGTTADALLEQLAAAGHPVIRIELADPIDIGGEFVRWEVATAIAGAVLGIDAFDQPNVEEAKVLTRKLLARHEAAPDGSPPVHEAPTAPLELLASSDGLALFGDGVLAAGGPADDRRGRPPPPPRPSQAERLPVPPGLCRGNARARRRDRPDPGAPARSHRPGHHCWLRTAVPALDRPAPQGRRADRPVLPVHGRPSRTTARSRAGRTRSAS